MAMFTRTADDDAATQHLLNQDHEELSHGMVWDRVSATSENHVSNNSEIWEQDPLQGGEAHELKGMPPPQSHPSAPKHRARTQRIQSEDHGEAATELEEEFRKIFNPMKKDQQEKTRFHNELDAACAAYSERLEEMQERQREQESTIEKPWLLARRRREWERFVGALRGFGTVATCFCGGTVASLDELPSQIPWPPPHLVRMKENHANEKQALREAHLAVVDELRKKYKFELHEDGETEVKHICVERRLLLEVAGDISIPTDDIVD